MSTSLRDTYATSFSRNIGIIRPQEQEVLKQSTVAIAGLGGIGGNTLVSLARMGIGRFRIADFDSFELANINRQHGATVDRVGLLKTEILADEVRRINPEAEIEVFSEGFTDATGDALLAGADIAIDAIDFYAIETHLQFHRATRRHGLYTLMGSPVGFSACLQVFDPKGMSLTEYCDIREDMPPLEKQLRYACGLVPTLAHISYFDVSAASSNTDFLRGTGPSLGCAAALAAALVATETGLILLGRRPPRCIPDSYQLDPYAYRSEWHRVPGGMANYDPEPALSTVPDRSSLVAQVLELLYRKRRSQKAPVNGTHLYFKVEGSGESLVLISPLGADASFWARQTEELAKRFRVISFDNRGSDGGALGVSELTTEVLADDVIALLDHLEVTRAHVAGLALGGLVAQHVALKRPDLVAGLALVSCYAVADQTLRTVTSEWRHIAMNEGMPALFDRCVPYLFSEPYVANHRGELDKLKTFYHLTLQDPLCFCQQSSAGVRHDTSKALGEIQAPTLVIHGGADRLVAPALGQSLAAGIPKASFVALDGAPHFMTWEWDEQFNRSLVEFFATEQMLR